jgi:hypothetical protein
MEIEAELVAELWNTIRDYVPVNKRKDLITSILEILVDNEVEINDLDEIKNVDDDLDEAIEEVFEQEENEEEDY